MGDVNVLEFVARDDPFGELFFLLIDADIKKIYPEGDYTKTDVRLTLNGVEVPPERLKTIFFRYADEYAKRHVRKELDKILEPIENSLHDVRSSLEKAGQKIQKSIRTPEE